MTLEDCKELAYKLLCEEYKYQKTRLGFIINFPEVPTKIEFEQWKTKYPDVYNHYTNMAHVAALFVDELKLA